MSEEEILKECTELAENEHHELGNCWDEEYSSSAIFGLIMLYKQTKKELNNIKEIEKSHKEENGKLRVELEQEKEKNKAFHKFIMFTGGKDIKDFSATEYMRIRQEAYIDGRAYEKQKAEEILMKNYISKDKIKEKLELLKDILKAKEKDENIYKQIPIEYLKGAIEQLEELLEEK